MDTQGRTSWISCSFMRVAGRTARSGTECNSRELHLSFADSPAGTVWALPDADVHQNTVALSPRNEHRYVAAKL